MRCEWSTLKLAVIVQPQCTRCAGSRDYSGRVLDQPMIGQLQQTSAYNDTTRTGLLPYSCFKEHCCRQAKRSQTCHSRRCCDHRPRPLNNVRRRQNRENTHLAKSSNMLSHGAREVAVFATELMTATRMA